VLDADMLLMVLVGDDGSNVQLHACQLDHPTPGRRACLPIGSAPQRTVDRAPKRAQTGQSPPREPRALTAYPVQHVPGECSPTRRDARLAGWPPHRSARG
jgi:hypothetical protein